MRRQSTRSTNAWARTVPWIRMVILCVATSAASPLTAQQVKIPGSPRASLFTLSDFYAFLNVNDFQCTTSSDGFCKQVFETPFAQGGWWPKGTFDGYMYGAGLQLYGIIPAAAGCTNATRSSSATPGCFAWSGDTTGAFFYEGTGNARHSRQAIPLYDSTNPKDLAAWPAAGSITDFPEANAFITDTAIFDTSLIGRKSISQQDTWGAFWDGDVNTTSNGRTHAMGVLVEQRTLAWNAPIGAEATIFQIYKITNITNNRKFQTIAEAKHFGGRDSLPDAGWRIDSIYVTYDADPDVGAPGNNYDTPMLPFNAMYAYSGHLFEPSFTYPAEQFHPPFFGLAPGFVATQFLRTPVDTRTGAQIGVTSYTTYQDGNATPFPAPKTVQRAWRRASFNIDPSQGDQPCNLSNAESKARRMCFLLDSQSDVRGDLASGPFSLDPGKSVTVIVAMYAAPVVETPLLTSAPTADNKPGTPTTAPGCNGAPVRPVEIGLGYLTPRTCPVDGQLKSRDINVVPGSALARGQTAQAIVDHKFLMPSAPDAPAFTVVPGDTKVTIAWEPSATEKNGDAYAAVAAEPLIGLYDPNFRKQDLEGYRVYRGTSPTDLKIIAQFDNAGTQFIDNACVTDKTHVDGTPCSPTGARLNIAYDIVQYQNITMTPNGAPRVLRADTSWASEIRNGTGRYVSNTRIPYGYVDNDVRNGFRYFYKVTAFDFNSILSGPSSMDSGGDTKSAIPRAESDAAHPARVQAGLFGRDGLLPKRDAPRIDSITGTFSGPALPTAGLTGSASTFADQLLSRGAREIRIDSVVPQYYAGGSIATYFLKVDGKPFSATFTNAPISGQAESETIELPVVLLPADDSAQSALRAHGVDAGGIAGSIVSTIKLELPHFNSAGADWVYKQPSFWTHDQLNAFPGGSRWFSGENETMPDPTYGVQLHGTLPGVTRIFQPTPYLASGVPDATAPALANYRGTNGISLSGDIFRRFNTAVFGVTRAADVRLYWGRTDGAGNPSLDSVIDVTHNVRVEYSSAARATFGFLTDADHDGKLTYGDFYYTDGLVTTPATEITPLAQRRQSLARQPVMLAVDVTGDLVPDGSGFGLYIDGEPYLFQTSAPSNTVWTLRTYNGTVTRNTKGIYSFAKRGETPAVPGLRFAIEVSAPERIIEALADLSKVHAVPDPYYASSEFDASPTQRQIQLVNLPPRATIRIYTVSGILVHTMTHDDATGGGRTTWDLRAPNGKFVASGVYYFHIATPDGRTSIGKFTVISPPN